MRVSIDEAALRSAFDSVRDSTAFAESAALVARGMRPVEMLQAMALRPEILRAFAATSEAIYPGGIVERRVKELIILEASRRNACQFCRDSHVSIARSLGIGLEAKDGELDPLALLDSPDRMDERERAAVEYVRAAHHDPNRVADAVFERLARVYSQAEIVELTAMIGLITMLNIFNNLLQVTYRGEYDA